MNTSDNHKKRDSIAVLASELSGYTYEYCRLVRNGKRNNEELEDMMVEIAIGTNKLKEEVKRICPFDKPKRALRNAGNQKK